MKPQATIDQIAYLVWQTARIWRFAFSNKQVCSNILTGLQLLGEANGIPFESRPKKNRLFLAIQDIKIIVKDLKKLEKPL